MRLREALLICLAFLAGCTSEPEPEQNPKVTREVVDGVEVTNNVWGSAWEEQARLVEELAIGVAEGEEPYLFGRISSVAATTDRVFVLDASVPLVRIYDASGTYLGDAGSAGQGPGEYERPGGLTVSYDDRLLVADVTGMRVLVYSVDGEHLDTWRWQSGVMSFSLPSILPRTGGAWVAGGRVVDGELEIQSGWWAVGPDGPAETLHVAPVRPERPTAATVPTPDGREMRVGGLIPILRQPVQAMAPDGTFYSGDASTYRIRVDRPDGARMDVIRHWEPVAVTQAERDAYIRRAEVRVRRTSAAKDWLYNGPEPGPFRPAYSAIATDMSRDRIWVSRQGPGRLIEGCDPEAALAELDVCWEFDWLWDVFGSDGTYLGEIQPPDGARLYLTHIAGDRLTTALTDGDGIIRVHQLRLVVGDGSP